MAANRYPLGATVTFFGSFSRRSTGLPVDPASVYVVFTKPDATQITRTYGADVSVTKTAAGDYECAFEPTVAGIWTYQWKSTGNGLGDAADVKTSSAKTTFVVEA